MLVLVSILLRLVRVLVINVNERLHKSLILLWPGGSDKSVALITIPTAWDGFTSANILVNPLQVVDSGIDYRAKVLWGQLALAAVPQMAYERLPRKYPIDQ